MILSRFDYFQVSGTSRSSISLFNTTRVLIVGDQSGELSMYALDSSTKSWSVTLRNISHIEISNETLYASTGCNVYSFSSSGKELSSFDTNVAESIKTFKVRGSEIWTVGKYLYNHYINQKEANYLILRDTINDFCVSNITGDLINNSILACNDKSIRIITGTDTIYTCLLPSAPSTIKIYSPQLLLFGTVSGGFGMLSLQREQGQILWHLQLKNNEISAICSYCFYSSGSPDIIIGRTDGSLEIYSYNPETFEVSLTAETNLSESITGIVAGKFKNQSELIISTFTGKIIGIRDNSMDSEFDMTKTISGEIEGLKARLEESKRKSVPTGLSNQSTSKASYKLSLLGEQAAYCLSLENQAAIGIVMIQSEIPIELLEGEDNDSIITCVEEESQTLITLRFSDTSHTRAEIVFRNSEGQPGTLSVYVIPSLEPKIAQMLTVEIKPLSLHEKVLTVNTADRPLNTIKATGSFNKNEMHGWISQTLPDVPPSSTDDVITLYYTSCVIGSILIISYSSNWAEFRSESVSVLAILKESITKHASFRKINLNVGFIEAPDSCEFVIRLVEVHIADLQALETRFQLIEAMKEIEIQGDLTKFGEELSVILEQAEEIRTQYKKHPKKLQFFQGMISDLYVDYCKFRGLLNFVDRIPHLQSLLSNFEPETLIEFFKH